jgi:DNA-binding transcriptional LysR family regulator
VALPSPDPLPARELAAFVAAVEAGTVQGAADALALTQSAATKRIQSLERRLGVALLQRTSRGVVATDAGRLLYPDAKEALDALHRAERRLRAAAGPQAQVLPLAASHTVGDFLLPAWLAGFRAIAPEVHPQVEVVNSPSVLAAVRERRVAIGFVEGLDPLDGLETLTLVRDEIVAVVAPGHRWARRRAVPAEELPTEAFHARERGSGTRAVPAARLAARGVALEPQLEVASTQSLKRAVLGGGFALLSRLAVVDEVRAGTLAAVPVAGVDLHRELLAVRRPGAAGGGAGRLWRWLVGLSAEGVDAARR